MSSIKKRFNLNWMFEAPEAVLACATMKCGEKSYLLFGGHDKTLYLMDNEMQILDTVSFDGWVRCIFPIDITGDGCDELLVGAGDGNFIVVKFVKGINKLATIMNFKATGKVLCVTAGDFMGNGNIELMEGGEDKTLKIFESIGSTEPAYMFYYDSWCTACMMGCVKQTDSISPINALLVGTKSGYLQLITYNKGNPEILWQKSLGSQINSIDIGDVTNDGINEIVVGTDDSKLTIFNADGDVIKVLDIDAGRPITLRIIDIDGDNAKEIIVGCADGSLRVYHNPQIDSTDIELKWKTSTSSSIKIVSPLRDEQEGLIKLIFGGYDRSLRCISDFEYGEKQEFNIPDRMGTPQVKIDETEVVEKVSTNSSKTIPANIREYIFKIMEDKGIIDGLITELEKMGYVREKVLEEIALMKSQPRTYEVVSCSLWELSEEQIGEGGFIQQEQEVVSEQSALNDDAGLGVDLIKALQKNAMQEELVPETVDQPPTLDESQAVNENLQYIIMHYLEKNGIVLTRTKLVNDIVILGYSEDSVEEQFEILKDKGLIQYSKANPKGWYLVQQNV